MGSTERDRFGAVGVRRSNLEQILSALRRADPDTFVTREDLANDTQLALATVARALAPLVEDGTIVESGRSDSSLRGAQGFRLTPAVPGFVVAVEFSHHKLAVAVGDVRANIEAWQIEDEPSFDVDSAPDAAIQMAAEMLLDLVGDRDTAELVGIGVAVAAPISGSPRQTLRQVRSLGGPGGLRPPNWVGVRPAQELRARLRHEWTAPIEVDNDVNFAALDEFRWSQRHWSGTLRDVIHVKWASGIGGGLILNGRLHRGLGGLAGEVGHSPIPDLNPNDREGLEPCDRCGRDACLESVISYDRMRKLIGRNAKRHEVDESDAGQELMSRYSPYLGSSLAPLVNALNPQLLVISGPTDPVRDIVLGGVREGLHLHSPPEIRRDVQVKLAEQRWEHLGDSGARFSVVSGAMHRVLDLHGGSYLRSVVERTTVDA
jgi:predicted NBD/HSP70 family sugar kinase